MILIFYFTFLRFEIKFNHLSLLIINLLKAIHKKNLLKF
jgi:hypothetical protein